MEVRCNADDPVILNLMAPVRLWPLILICPQGPCNLLVLVSHTYDCVYVIIIMSLWSTDPFSLVPSDPCCDGCLEWKRQTDLCNEVVNMSALVPTA